MKNNHTPSQVVLTYKNPTKKEDRIKVTCSKEIYNFLSYEVYDPETIEHHMTIKLLLLNRDLEVLGVVTIAEGWLEECPFDLRIAFQAAILANASALVLSRNSPSGNLTPSLSDKNLSQKFAQSCDIFRFKYIDYIIVNSGNYHSFADEGII